MNHRFPMRNFTRQSPPGILPRKRPQSIGKRLSLNSQPPWFWLALCLLVLCATTALTQARDRSETEQHDRVVALPEYQRVGFAEDASDPAQLVSDSVVEQSAQGTAVVFQMLFVFVLSLWAVVLVILYRRRTVA